METTKEYLDKMLSKHLPRNKYITTVQDLINFDNKQVREDNKMHWKNLVAELRENMDQETMRLLDYSVPTRASWQMVIGDSEKSISYCYAISNVIPYYIDWILDHENRNKRLIDSSPYYPEKLDIIGRIIKYFPNHKPFPKELYSVFLPAGINVFDRKKDKGRYIDIFFSTNVIPDQDSGFDFD